MRSAKAGFHGFEASIAPDPASMAVWMKGAGRGAARAQDPFHVAGHRQPPRALGGVAQGQAGNPDRILERDVLEQLQRQAARGVLEAAVAEAMAGDVGRGLVADRLGGRRPEFAGVLVTHEERVTDRSVTGSLDQGVSWCSWALPDQL